MFTVYAYMKKLRGAGLTLAERGMLMAILSYANKDGTNAHPGHATLAADLEVSVRYVGTIIKSLRAKGFLLQTRPGRRGPDGDVPACYSVVIPTGTIVPADLSEQVHLKAQDSIGTIVPPTVGTREIDQNATEEDYLAAVVASDDPCTDDEIPEFLSAR